ncbi:MAG: exo-alpha-sialidase [Ignavibacteriales bacterium]|nr:exo-alpha-sialidase [Ignavibacteriales bacterium]
MKKILLLVLTTFIFSCTSNDYNSTLLQNQYVFPVLKFKDYNNVLQIVINSDDSLETTYLNKISINTDGTTNLNDIETASIYSMGDSEDLLNDKKVLFSETKNITAIIDLKGKIKLKKGDNFFWFSYKLKNNAKLQNKLFARVETAETNHGKLKIQKLTNPIGLKIGIALRKHNDDNVNTYRIPSLVKTNNGSLLAAYDVRRNSSRDLQGDIDIGISRSTDNGETWEPMRIALNMKNWGNLPEKFNGVSDASLIVDKNNNNVFVAGLWMHGVINEKGEWIENLNEESIEWNHQWRNKGSQPGFGVKETSQFLISKSTDEGLTWEPPINLTKMCKKEEWWLWAPAPGNGITLNDGTLVLPTQGRDKNGMPFSNITYSKDNGKTWVTSNSAFSNTTESSVVQLENGNIMLNMRYNQNRNNLTENNGRVVCTTANLGETWTEHKTSRNTLNEPVCMASLIKHEYVKDGKSKSVLIFSNPNTKKGRQNITLKFSFDDGNSWPKKYWILLDEGFGNGYSCLASINENQIGILYEGSQANLVFQKISIENILE